MKEMYIPAFQSINYKTTHSGKAYIFTTAKSKYFHLFIEKNGMHLPTYVQNLYMSKIISRTSPKSDFWQL